MRVTVNLDSELIAKARDFSGIQDGSALLQQALKRMVEKEASRRLARMGAACPDLTHTRRRQAVPGNDIG
ncbi:type II toxin-antitoxin system VapB family antitoxin [Bordetella sp. 15P40C-2]|uniref:type II toxin-antitoxin system VapB family antitoxin n=1 Tax=Bordetella sp. 15P40C-2 TaxID=2572246 RepID=UPI001325A088|nr:type II toxin-antitoxin system VapB family antitoxin [Bordetella sp. 15P40C-2]MVW71631.1 type II toxin-antitoxin system VapB family antitoxin [Bordetella sp. 15P40C-2]